MDQSAWDFLETSQRKFGATVNGTAIKTECAWRKSERPLIGVRSGIAYLGGESLTDTFALLALLQDTFSLQYIKKGKGISVSGDDASRLAFNFGVAWCSGVVGAAGS